MAQPLFGIVPAGLPVLITPSETPLPTSFIYSIVQPAGAAKPFGHVVVFLLPGVELPIGTAAAIYLVTPPATPGQTVPSSRFLGGIGSGKESAIFKISGSPAGTPTILGISIEDATSVAVRIEEMRGKTSASTAPATTSSSTAAAPSALELAQRIGQNAFNFLASYSAKLPASSGSSEEVVPMRAFEEWWRKFEGRVRNDPTFLERPAE